MEPRITVMALWVLLVLGAPSGGQAPTENPGPDMIKRWADLMSLRRAKPSVPDNPDPDMMKRVLEQARLQGEWLPKYLLTTNGIEPYPLKGRALDFTDNSFTQTEGRRRVQAGTFSLYPSSRGLDLVVEQHDAWDVGVTHQNPKVPVPGRGYCERRPAHCLLAKLARTVRRPNPRQADRRRLRA